MQRAVVLLAAAAVALALPALAAAGAIALRIDFKPSRTASPQLLTLTCGPARGTVPSPGRACRRLIAIGSKAFAPTRRGMRACAQVYGGPQTALVTGIYFGRPVWTRLSRVDGCANARWNAVAFLFPRA